METRSALVSSLIGKQNKANPTLQILRFVVSIHYSR